MLDITLLNFIAFMGVGVLGALVASSSGVGGGIIFIPFFGFVGISGFTGVSTSLGIQCIGMTAGSIGWLVRLQDKKNILKLALFCAVFGLAGTLAGEYLAQFIQWDQRLIFGCLSIGVALIISTLSIKNTRIDFDFHPAYALFAFIGGAFLYFISIGIGELIFLVAIWRGIDVKRAVALAVIVTALTVVPGFIILGCYAFVLPEYLIPIAIGALLGGSIASTVSHYVGKKMKLYCTAIIALTGCVELGKSVL